MSSQILTSEELLQKFDLTEDISKDVILFNYDWDIGFSLKIDYPDNTLFHPAITRSWSKDSVAFLEFLINLKK